MVIITLDGNCLRCRDAPDRIVVVNKVPGLNKKGDMDKDIVAKYSFTITSNQCKPTTRSVPTLSERKELTAG
jgi:hypothetical protein